MDPWKDTSVLLLTHIKKRNEQMTDYVVKDIALANFGCTPDVDGGFSWDRTDLIDASKRHFNNQVINNYE